MAKTQTKTEPKPLTQDGKERVIYRAQGNLKEVFYNRDRELLVSGPVRTGKSLAVMQRLHLIALKYPGVRILLCRKTRSSMTETVLYTWNQQVIHWEDGVTWRAQDQKYVYNNGSQVIIGGLDNTSKIMSSEYDIIYVQEARELLIDEWKDLLTRLSAYNIPWQQIIGDTNPDAPSHFLYKRYKDGTLKVIWSTLKDNPKFWNEKAQRWTIEGEQYVATLETLGSGVRYERFVLGRWAAAEGMVYEDFVREVHLIPRKPLPKTSPTYWSIDFGYRDPFVWQKWRYHDQVLYLEKEIYKPGLLVTQVAKDIIEECIKEDGTLEVPRAIICDHDAEGRAQLESTWKSILGSGNELFTLPAYKKITDGIQGVSNRLKRKTLFIMEDTLVHQPSEILSRIGHPLKTVDEFENYTWDIDATARRAEIPVDKYNHGMDALRYMVAYIDDLAEDPQEIQDRLELDEDYRVKISPY